MKYIDADKLRAEIERRYEENREKARYDDYYRGTNDGLDHFEQFLDTLPDEPITSCNELAEAAMNYIAPIENEDGLNVINFSGRDIKDAFIAGAEWQKKQIPMPEDTVIFQKGVEEGKRLMMEGATYNELMELYRAIRDELVKRHRDAAVNIKEKTMDLKEDTGNESALHQIRG